jgi:hypothetical protein
MAANDAQIVLEGGEINECLDRTRHEGGKAKDKDWIGSIGFKRFELVASMVSWYKTSSLKCGI